MRKLAPKIQCISLTLSLNIKETLYQRTARVLFLAFGIEHLTLAGQTVTLLNQRVNILATFQHTLNLEQCLRAVVSKNFPKNQKSNKKQKHTTVRIRWWSPTQLLTHRRVA